MNKRELIEALLDPNQEIPYRPAAFFLHFDAQHQRGQAAVGKPLEFFHYTDMDFVKIQYELTFPANPAIQKPTDWAAIPMYGPDFYAPQVEVVQGLVKAAKKEAFVVQTLYSPFMLAGQMAGERLLDHIMQDPQAVRKGMEIITESLLGFVSSCIQAGVDGFYVSTQGGEASRLGNTPLFGQCVKPYDLAVWNQIVRNGCPFSILHVCDYHAGYNDLSAFVDYPGQVVNCSLKLGTQTLNPIEVAKTFQRPFMGGMERLGVLSNGTPEEVRADAQRVLASNPTKFILGADCTVSSSTRWENLRTAINAAHGK